MSTRSLRYTYRIRPGRVALRSLNREAGRCRWVWNQCVAADRAARASSDKTPSGATLDKALTEWRAGNDWLAEGSSVAQQQTIRDWHTNRQAAFRVKGRRPPKFKAKRRDRPSLNYTRNGFKLRDGRLIVAGGVNLPVVWSRELPSDPTSVRVYQDSCGYWWASFVVQVEEAWPDADGAIGFDFGIKAVATGSSEGYDLPNPRHAKAAQATVAGYQRMMARRRPSPGKTGSGGYREADRKSVV